MDNNVLSGKWKEIKGEIQKAWGNITGDELERTKGDLKSISGLIQQKYGHKKDEISGRLHEIVGRFDAPVDRGTEEARPVSTITESIKDKLRN